MKGTRHPHLQELRIAHDIAQQQEHARGAQESDGRAQLREHAEPVGLARRRVLGGQQDRAAPLSAQPKALPEAAQRQQRRRQQARALVGGQKSYRYRGNAHREQRRHQRGLASDSIAIVAEHRRTHRAREEGQRERGQRLQHRGVLVRSGKEQRREHQHRGGSVDVEVEELDRGADQACEQHPARGIDLHGLHYFSTNARSIT
jgi:hypothetical protein